MRGGGAAAAGGRTEGEVRRRFGDVQVTFSPSDCRQFLILERCRSFGELHLASLLGVKLRLAAAVYPINQSRGERAVCLLYAILVL